METINQRTPTSTTFVEPTPVESPKSTGRKLPGGNSVGAMTFQVHLGEGLLGIQAQPGPGGPGMGFFSQKEAKI